MLYLAKMHVTGRKQIFSSPTLFPLRGKTLANEAELSATEQVGDDAGAREGQGCDAEDMFLDRQKPAIHGLSRFRIEPTPEVS